MNGCPGRDQLEQFLNGGLGPAAESAVVAHVESCAACRAVLDGLTRPAVVPPCVPWTLSAAAAPPPADREDDFPAVPGYVLGPRLGRGGMGVVFRARHVTLKRDVAVKLLRDDRRGQDDLARRFREEAQIAGQLQHPGIPPIHEAGTLADGRPFYSMKLVKGQTLSDLLARRPTPAHDLPHLLKVFEQVCQATAFAHGQGVIHRDLKPDNVMLGAFGEVYVMDWGLAKVLTDEASRQRQRQDADGQPTPPRDVETVRAGDTDQVTHTGVVLGTYAYMPPEQARGEAAHLGPRADVFALGAILCEVLTGESPYVGSAEEVRALARAGRLEPALDRLAACGAAEELVSLARSCLRPDAEGRPADAGCVALAVTAYQDGVQGRLRQAELAGAEAKARAQEARATAAAERRARRRTAALAAALLLLVVGGGGAALWIQQRLQATDQGVTVLLLEAQVLLDQARDDPLAGADKFERALGTARKAERFAGEGGAAPRKRQEAADLVRRLDEEAQAASLDRALLAALVAVRGPREAPGHATDSGQAPPALTERSADEQFRAAFLAWDPSFDLNTLTTAEAAARLRGRPAAVLTEVVAALDEWAAERRRAKPPGDWRQVADLAAALDGSPDRSLRGLLFDTGPRNAPPLRRLAEEANPEREPVLRLLTLARALREAGDGAGAERLLRRALLARPREVVLYDALGRLLQEQQPPRWAEAVECYRAVKALRPELGEALAWALAQSGRAEGVDVYDELLRQREGDPWLHFRRGNALQALGRPREAVEDYIEALRRQTEFPEALNNLGNALFARLSQEEGRADPSPVGDRLARALLGQLYSAGALAAYGAAIRQRPYYAEAHYNLGNLLLARRHYNQAAESYRQAIALKPDYSEAHNNLGQVRMAQGRYKEAEAAYREGIRCRPDFAGAHNNLGIALFRQGRYPEAEAAYRAALRCLPRYPAANYNLGLALKEQRRYAEAEDEYRTALVLRPDHAETLCNLGQVLAFQGRFESALSYLERGHELGRKTPGWAYPSALWIRECREMYDEAGRKK